MRNLIEFLARYNHWLLLLVLETVSLVLLFRFNSYQGSVWFTSANSMAGSVLSMSSEVESFFSLGKVNEDLTKRNVYLEQKVRQLEEKLHYSTQARDTMPVATTVALPAVKLIKAKVVDNSISKIDNYITIDKGSADGVRRDMGVACGTGVVGIVYLVAKHYSVVIPVLNSKSNISCAINGRGYFGYLHWSGGRSDIAYVDDIPRHAHFKLHEKVVTSGYSSVFPPGLMVGEILHVFNSTDGLSYRLQLRLSTDFSRLRDVCVIDDAAARERMEVYQAAIDSLKTRE
jgi:rod shape-determining protein MreC